MNILALDTGGSTGWALYYQKKIYSGTQIFPKLKCDDNGVVLTFFRSWINNMLRLYNIDVIYYEQPHFRGVGTQILVGYVTIVQQLCSVYAVKWVEIHSATLKKIATDNGRADKEEMMAAARQKKWKFETYDECDALWLLDYAIKNTKEV
jgi:hypothetical protein